MRVTNQCFIILLQQGLKGEVGISGEQGIPGPPVCCAFNSLIFLTKLPKRSNCVVSAIEQEKTEAFLL